MGKIYYRILISSLVVLFFQSMTGAVSSEYKNSLEKLELQKTGESNYNINLYMQKNYTSPVKVIKKNDLNYYILLPETKNISSALNYKTSEIQNVSTDVYPYAGIDVNNGYTKININTTKPLDFNLVIINPSSAVKQVQQSSVVAQKNNNENKAKEDVNKVEKKSQNPTKINSNTTPAVKSIIKEKQQNTVAAKNTQKKAESIPTVKENNTKSLHNTQKTTIKPKIAETKSLKSQTYKETTKEKQVAKAPVVKKENKKPEPKDTQVTKNTEIEKDTTKTYNDNQIEENDTTSSYSEEKTEQYFDDDSALIATNTDTGEEEYAYAARIPITSTLKTKLANISQLIKNKFESYGIGLFDIAFMLITTLCAFVIILFIMSNRQNGPKIKRKIDLFDLNDRPSLIPKKAPKDDIKNSGQYFVFDKGIKQTGLLDPTTSNAKKNYELSTYDPDLNSNYSYNPVVSNQQSESEYDIIQKILKEDAYIEINHQQPETITKEKIEINKNVEEAKKMVENQVQKSSAVTSPIAKNTTTPVEEAEKQDELTVLSKVEIAPERGFMCVSYENNVSLIGYIFDDIFVLHNFKKPELENYDIQYRLSEKDDQSSLYIVKVIEEKMIVRVDAKAMKLEINL